MPTLTVSWPDGTTAVLGDSPTSPVVPPADAMSAPLSSDAVTVPSPDASPPSSGPTAGDVKAALNTVPPKWMDAAASFVRSVIAAGVMTYTLLYGGDIGKVIHDPVGFGIALGTACLTAGWRFLRYKEQ